MIKKIKLLTTAISVLTLEVNPLAPAIKVKKNKKKNKKKIIINQTVPRERKKYFGSGLVYNRFNKDSFNCNLNGLLSFKSIEKLSKLAL